MKRSLHDSKANVQLISAGIFTLIMASFLLVMGLMIMDTLEVDLTDTTGTVHNDTITPTETCATVNATAHCGFNAFTILHIVNASAPEVLTGNFSVLNGRAGKVCYTGNVGNNTAINVSYTYKYSNSEACFAANETTGAQGKFADYFDLIVIAIVITTIISMLVVLLAGRRIS